MYDTCIYRIELCGEADEAELNAISPLRVSIELTDSGSSLLTVCTDQSGLVGLMRHLHGLGFVFLSMQREESVPYGALSSFPNQKSAVRTS